MTASTGVTVDTPLTKVIGGKTAKGLADHLDLTTVGDLLYHFPRRYDERGEHTEIRTLSVGEQVTVLAQVRSTNLRPLRQRNSTLLEVTVGDGSGGVLTLTFFGPKQAWRERDLRPGRWGMFAGKVTEFRGKRQLNSPEYVLLGDDLTGEAAGEVEEFAGALIPVYAAAAAVPTWVIARCVRVVLDVFTPPPDPMPAAVLGERRLVDLGTAIREIHRPTSRESLAAARKRLKWDEAFAVQLTLVQRKHRAADSPATPRPMRSDGALARFDATLPYELTGGQQAVGVQIAHDLASEHTRCTGCCRARSGPARRSARCARCSRSSTPAGRPPCSRRPRSSPPSTCAASASCSGRSVGPASWTATRTAPRSRSSPGRSVRPGGGPRSGPLPPVRPASSSARTPCSTRVSTSPISGSWWSTSSIASASNNATRYAPRPPFHRTCSS